MFRSSDFGKDKPMKIFSIIALAAMGFLPAAKPHPVMRFLR